MSVQYAVSSWSAAVLRQILMGRFVVHAVEKLTAFLELEAATRAP
jgi:hypothetical protein